jgi:3'(2'), 5'-bisphosphate nucleotidase
MIDETLLEKVIAIAEKAARRILDVYETDFAVERKDDRSPLTEADMAAHQTIIAGLSALEPSLPIVSEESAQVPAAERLRWTRYWLVDPLDGTREFVKRNGEFTVNIALIDGHRPVLGVVYVPVSGVCYYAGSGVGAYKREPDGASRRIHVRQFPAGTVTVAGSRSHRDPQTEAFIGRLGQVELISIGSSLKTCLVAEGRADVYPRFGETSEWDTAAAQCVVEQAGGHLTDTELRPLRYNTGESLINPPFLVYGDDAVDWHRYLSGAARA